MFNVTALMLAAQDGNKDMVRLLFAKENNDFNIQSI